MNHSSAKRLLCSQGGQNVTSTPISFEVVSTISSELPILLQPNSVMWYIVIIQGVLSRDWIAVVRITAKGHNFIEFLSHPVPLALISAHKY